MKSAEQTISMDDAAVVYRWHFERRNLIAEGLRRFPKSTRLVKEYFDESLKTIDEYEQLLPERALDLYERATNEIIETIDKQLVRKTLYPLRLDIGKKWHALKRKLARERLPGKPLPELGDVEWLLNRDGSSVIEQTDGVLMLVFWSSTDQEQLGQLIALSDKLKNQFPDVRLCVVTHQLGELFGSLPFVTFKNELTDENRQSFKEQMSKKIVEANGFEFPIGISGQVLELSDRFGVETTPFGVIVRDGECQEPKWGPEMQGELIRQLGF